MIIVYIFFKTNIWFILGTTNDGWSIKVTEKLTQAGNTAAHAIPPIITTQIQKPCPQAIIRGFINQVDIDPTLRIVCLVGTNKNSRRSFVQTIFCLRHFTSRHFQECRSCRHF